MKKVLGILLSVAMVIAMMPATAFAAGGPLTSDKVSLSAESAVYINSPVSLPTVNVSGGVKDVDYTVQWKKGTDVVTGTTVSSVGTYTAVVTAKAGSSVFDSGTVSKDFVVKLQDNFAYAVITYTGDTEKTSFPGFDAMGVASPITTPSITSANVSVTIAGNKIDPSKYIVSNVRKAGVDRISFLVTPNDVSMYGMPRTVEVQLTTDISKSYRLCGSAANGDIPDQQYSGSELKPAVYAVPLTSTSYYYPALSQGTECDVVYSSNINAGIATVKVTGKGKYHGTLTKQFKITGKPISYAYASASNTLIGQEPNLTVMDGGKYLQKGVDYTVATFDSKALGTGTATIQGMGNYTGLKDKITYKVVADEIKLSNVAATGNTVVYYNDTAIVPNVTVKIGTKTLSRGVDYDLIFDREIGTDKYQQVAEMRNAGMYRVTVVGKGNYAVANGKLHAVWYKIMANPLDWASPVATSTMIKVNGKDVPKISLKSITGTYTYKDTDFTVEYKDLTSFKPYAIITPVEGGNLTKTGSKATTLTAYFGMSLKPISGCKVDFANGATSKAYDGTSFVPPLTIRDYQTGAYLAEGMEYTVQYKKDDGTVVTTLRDAGTYTITVTGKAQYTGTLTLSYRIMGRPQTVTLDKTSYKLYDTSAPFYILARATGDGTGFRFTSSDPEVATVSAGGLVTINKIGRAKITVTTVGSKAYEPASASVYVKVYPKKTKITQRPQTLGKTGSFKVRWGIQNGVTRYEVKYSKNKAFAEGTYAIKKVAPHKLPYVTQSTTVKGLSRGTTYYVRVRAVKEVRNDAGKKLTYYGLWSNWRSVKTK